MNLSTKIATKFIKRPGQVGKKTRLYIHDIPVTESYMICSHGHYSGGSDSVGFCGITSIMLLFLTFLIIEKVIIHMI